MKLSIFFLMCALIVPCIPAVAAAEGDPGLINSLNGKVEYSEYSNTTSKEEEPLMLLIHKAGYKGGWNSINQEWDDYIPLADVNEAVLFQYYHSCRPASVAETQLIEAIKDNDLQRVKVLLASGVNPNVATLPDIESPLYLAIGDKSNAECDGTHLKTEFREGQTELAKTLLQAGASPNLPSTLLLHTPLMEAARTGDIVLAKLLLQKGADIHARSDSGMTALHFAAAESTPKMVKLLLAQGATPNLATTSEGFLLESDATKGVTPLHLAAEAGMAESVQLLLQAGAYADTPDAEGNTPYFYAAMRNHTDCMQILHAAGAETKFLDKERNTPEETAH
ncbi:MAG: ankyrin repeat domain-containing protein [Akkermansia sp.]|nr:ankyrin repeat domain-containing protein [Akkermansia sp.]